MAWRSRVVKRAVDLTVGTGALVVFSPLMVGVGIAVAVTHGWPPLFSQARPGLRGRVFRIYKFRTMTNERGPDGELLPDAARLTAFGRFLRSTSLDELPELWNVVRGDMSLVGPRPLLVSYLPLYSAEQARRHDVRPGITGWAAVNGRNLLGWEERFAMDVWYVDNWSLGLDLKILVRTIGVALGRDGVSAEGHVTMRPFEGS
jgi:lipopolysaccharide/colanic/teichoic acid biosynthesis glycosyltransferase